MTAVRRAPHLLWSDEDGPPFEVALAGAKDGESWAFRHFFGQLGPAVTGYFRAQQADDPDELANDVFLRAFRSVARFSGGQTQFRSWIFTLAHNVLIDDRRRSSRRVATVDLMDRVKTVAGGDVEDDAWRNLGDAEVYRLLSLLTDEQREVIFLRVVADLSAGQVASVMRRSPAAVRALQHRALKSLRRSLAS